VKYNIPLIISILIIGSILTPFPSAGEDSLKKIFFDANSAYKEGSFDQAVDGYKRLIESGYANGHIYYNLGNTYFRLNHLGKAILNYERARLFLPRDADIHFNLRHARDQIKDVIEEEDLTGMTFFWLKDLTLKEHFWGFAIVNFFFWAILLIRLFLRSDRTYYAYIILIIIWFISGLSFSVKGYQIKSDKRAVIIAKEVDILSGPDSSDTVLFKLHEGFIVRVERQEGEWVLARLSEKNRGWLKAEGVESIRGKG